MKDKRSIFIWEPCHSIISDAIQRFECQWNKYSIKSRRYHIIKLIRDVIDPAISTYITTLPPRYSFFVTGGGVMGLSEVIRLIGFDQMMKAQHQLLRQFTQTLAKETPIDQCFIATINSLKELALRCRYKRPKTSSLSVDIRLNTQRRQGLCAYCGEMTEFTALVTGINENHIMNIANSEHKKLELSHQYCSQHRPRLTNGKWNPVYRSAKRSLEEFNIELTRLINQSFDHSTIRAQSGDPLVDQYFANYISKNELHPTDESELRNIARRMVDSKLTDNKKKILVLKKTGLNQTEIANVIQGRTQQPLSRQAVSRLLASVRKEFKL